MRRSYNDVFNNKIKIQIYICDLHIREYIGQIPFGKIRGKSKEILVGGEFICHLKAFFSDQFLRYTFSRLNLFQFQRRKVKSIGRKICIFFIKLKEKNN